MQQVILGDDFVVAGTKGSLSWLKKEKESLYAIEASIIEADSTKSINAINRRVQTPTEYLDPEQIDK